MVPGSSKIGVINVKTPTQSSRIYAKLVHMGREKGKVVVEN